MAGKRCATTSSLELKDDLMEKKISLCCIDIDGNGNDFVTESVVREVEKTIQHVQDSQLCPSNSRTTTPLKGNNVQEEVNHKTFLTGHV